MFKEVKEAMQKVEERLPLEFSLENFKGCSKEEKIDVCQDAIDEVDDVIEDLGALRDALEDYSDALED